MSYSVHIKGINGGYYQHWPNLHTHSIHIGLHEHSEIYWSMWNYLKERVATGGDITAKYARSLAEKLLPNGTADFQCLDDFDLVNWKRIAEMMRDELK